MKPAAFDLLIPDTLGEALDALAQHGDEARIIAGGQSLTAMLNMRLTEPSVLIDISRLADLGTLRIDADGLTVGAATTQGQVASHSDLPTRMPLVAQALTHVGHLQTRNRGTVCGSLCHADPSAEMPLLLATLGGTVTLQSRTATRTLAASEFQTGFMTTARAPDEILTQAHFPSLPSAARWGFREISRRDGDFAIIAMACVAQGDHVRLGVAGVADTPFVEEWQSLTLDQIPDALNAMAWEMGGSDDIHATARYRRELVRRIGKSLIEEVTT